MCDFAAGHNQTKVFITHCGMNGMMEAFYAGVPLRKSVPYTASCFNIFYRLKEPLSCLDFVAAEQQVFPQITKEGSLSP